MCDAGSDSQAIVQSNLTTCSLCLQQQMMWLDWYDSPSYAPVSGGITYTNGVCILPASYSPGWIDNNGTTNQFCVDSMRVYSTAQDCLTGVGWCRQNLGLAGPCPSQDTEYRTTPDGCIAVCPAVLYATVHIGSFLIIMTVLLIERFFPSQQKFSKAPFRLLFQLAYQRQCCCPVETPCGFGWNMIGIFVFAPLWFLITCLDFVFNVMLRWCCHSNAGDEAKTLPLHTLVDNATPPTSQKVVDEQLAATFTGLVKNRPVITKPFSATSSNSEGGTAARAAAAAEVSAAAAAAAVDPIDPARFPSAPPQEQSRASSGSLRASMAGFAALGRALATAGALACKGAIVRDGFSDDDLPLLQRMKVEMLVAKYGMTAEQARIFRRLNDEVPIASAAAAAQVIPDHLTDQ